MDKFKIIDSIVSMSWLCLALVITIFVLSFTKDENKKKEKEYLAFCGTTNSGFSISQPDSLYVKITEGKKLFKNNCAQCHNKNMKDDLTGPALGGVKERWKDYPKEDLYNWIRSSQKLVTEKHPKALSLWKEWNQTVMNDFPDLSNDDIEAILIYIEGF